MVRLSLIVLGLLAAAWCFTGTTEGLRVRRDKRSTNLSCGRGQVIKVGRCYRVRSCARVTYTSGYLRCISWRSARVVKKCNKKRSCWVSKRRISKGRYVCKYKCVRGRRSRRSRRGKCHTKVSTRKICRWARVKGRCHRRLFGGNHCHRRLRRVCRKVVRRTGKKRCRSMKKSKRRRRRKCHTKVSTRKICRWARVKGRCHRGLFGGNHCHRRLRRVCRKVVRRTGKKRCRSMKKSKRRRRRKCHTKVSTRKICRWARVKGRCHRGLFGGNHCHRRLRRVCRKVVRRTGKKRCRSMKKSKRRRRRKCHTKVSTRKICRWARVKGRCHRRLFGGNHCHRRLRRVCRKVVRRTGKKRCRSMKKSTRRWRWRSHRRYRH
ncbi:uncharacterized protein LOC115577598 [Sparus aurata]|uniref:uncharacterized protein LOC115577598 n=1 Tax=Sparus aurata TaxID=8175 RepID=UPI0011C16D85|nr:uncharacterized protein LOC115577598 [Sparus aurata]